MLILNSGQIRQQRADLQEHVIGNGPSGSSHVETCPGDNTHTAVYLDIPLNYQVSDKIIPFRRISYDLSRYLFASGHRSPAMPCRTVFRERVEG